MKKYTLFHFATGDFKAVERYLNHQADKGWELERTGLLFARWKKTERTDLRWCVDLANPKENRDREARKEYIDFCAEGGWELLTLYNGMFLFKSLPGRNPPPVQTDPELERKNYNKYYVRTTILSAIYVVAMIAFYALLFFLAGRAGGDLEYTVETTKLEWHRHWLAVGTMAAVPLWGLWALWRLADFIRAMASNRGGVIGVPPRWVMWANCGASVLALFAALLFFLGVGLETALQTGANATLYILLAIWAGTFLYRAVSYEFELYPRERRTVRRLGWKCLVILAALAVGEIAAPYGEWDTSDFDVLRDYDGTMKQYALLEEEPVVRGEDLGIPLGAGDSDWLDLTHEYTPVGERWLSEYVQWDSGGWPGVIGCETYVSPTLRQARLAQKQMLAEMEWWSDSRNREKVASYLVLVAPPQVELEPITLPWADEAWYGANETASVLVVRVGRQVTRLSAPMELMTEEWLPIIEGRLAQ